MANNNIEQTNKPFDPYSNRLHHPTYIQEISIGDIFRRGNGKHFLVLAIAKNDRPVFNYQGVNHSTFKVRDQIKDQYTLSHEVGVISCFRLKRINKTERKGVIAFTHSQDELTKITHIQEKSDLSFSPRK